MVYLRDTERKQKRNKCCFVYGCFSTAANKPQLGFHKFPIRGKRNIVVIKKNGDKCIYDRRQLWIEALNIGKRAAAALDGVIVYVCSLHFARDDFYYNQDITGRRYLKEFAIPRRNLPARKTSRLTTKFNIRSLNRLKYRGYFNIHNPDGRKLAAARTSLGEEKLSFNPSYTKTVWVVRKPAASKEQINKNGSADEETPAQQNTEDAREETDNDEQCTIVNDSSAPNPWFTSELIIKEEPISDSEQDPDDVVQINTDSTSQVAQETNIEYDDNDLSYEPDGLVIHTEDEDETVPQEQQGGEEDMEQPDIDEPEVMILEGFGQEEESTEQYYESSEVYEEEEGDNYYQYYDQEDELGVTEACLICGVDNCENHPPPSNYQEDHFVCLICSEIFTSQKQLAIHSRAHNDMSEEEVNFHEDRTKSLTCEFCGRVLSTKSTLREHIMIHTGEKPHQCLLCGKQFRHKANLVVHVNGHAVISTYSCKKCKKAFTKKMDFEKHLKFHVDASGNPLVCKICNAVFKSQRTLYNHSQLHSRNGKVRAKKRDGSKNPEFVCKICDRALSTKATLREHMMIHSGEKPHECKICGRTIRHKANFIVHVQTHGQGKSYECDMCDEAFMRKADLTQHKQLQHSKSKLLRCPICSEVFKSPQKFNRHMEIHESVVYMNETEELNEFEPHILERFFDGSQSQ